MKREHGVLLVLSTALAVVGSVAADRLVGALAEERDLIFARFSVVRYETPEFRVESRINNLGFRDRDFRRERTGRFRVVAIGDSFTYGWGVAAEESWPKILEQRLRARGYDVEVANLGQPGASPSDYAKIAARSVPLLKPDLVIIGLLQGDDLAQTLLQPISTAERLKRILRSLYPAFIEMARRAPTDTVELGGEWQAQARELVAGYTLGERARFARIDAEIRRRFTAGRLNPALVDLAVRHPDYFLQPLELGHPEVRHAVAALATELGRIRRVSERVGAETIVVSVPLGAYTSRRKLDAYARMGFRTTDRMLTTTAMDSAGAAAASRATVPFHQFTRTFRAVAQPGALYFELDGHFAPLGSRLYGLSVEPVVAAALERVGATRDAE
ncbi:MAG TPA: GDSL-type esterase/lipase family protein [Gemmatimonadales bacterium]